MYGYYGYGYNPGFYFDPTYILIIIGAVISLWASARVKSTFARYDRQNVLRGMTGAQAAEMILHRAGIYDVVIQRVSAHLQISKASSSSSLDMIRGGLKYMTSPKGLSINPFSRAFL